MTVATEVPADYLRERRDRIRREIAGAELERLKLADLQERIVAADRAAEAATEAHQERCRPLQARLAEIDALMLDALSQREAVPAELEAERRELIKQRDAENDELARCQ
jgi:hypothetical protein